MTDFNFTTIISPNLSISSDALVDADAYFTIYSQNGIVGYKAFTKEGKQSELVVILSSLKEEIVMDDILTCLPELIEGGEEIAEKVFEFVNFDEDDGPSEEEELMEDLENTALVQPATIFSNYNSEE